MYMVTKTKTVLVGGEKEPIQALCALTSVHISACFDYVKIFDVTDVMN